jgi:hypothetical protein
MNRNAHRLAEPDRAAKHERHVKRDERDGHIASRRAVHHETPEARHQKREKGYVPPLAGRHPDLLRQQHHGQDAEVRRVEQMLVVETDCELAPDRNDGGHDRQTGEIGPEEQTEGQPGDERASDIESGQIPDTSAEVLCQQRDTQRRNSLRARYLEVEPGQAIYE